ncbi:FAD-dependent oxidoreductase [Candidatus Saccharibacteria bacterium]|jgi:thioredoxin reductase (NADPH)|nr:FAD-dependent oxidoreductase [Candidatus Saccharibacteria bacterium]
MSDEQEIYDVITIGAGPAALTAAIYSSRENLNTLLIEKGVIGGLAAITDQIDNYPGFADGVEGMKLAQQLRKQAERFGAKIELDEVKEIKNEADYKVVVGYSGEYKARAVLIATGSDYVKLGVPGEQELYGRGVHYCATCDGAFYNGKKLVTVGSGNSSAQESLFLTRFADSVDVLIRGDRWKASDVLVKEIEDNDKINVHFNVSVKEVVAEEGKFKKLVGTNKDGKDIDYDVDGAFVFIGLMPNTKFLDNSLVKLDKIGFIMTDEKLHTDYKGVFAAGDVRSGATMQIASAAGEGATAALHIREYLEN